MIVLNYMLYTTYSTLYMFRSYIYIYSNTCRTQNIEVCIAYMINSILCIIFFILDTMYDLLHIVHDTLDILHIVYSS